MGVSLTWQEWHAIAESRGQTIKRLAQENAKLRELVSILVHCMNEVDNCHTCPINGNPYDVRAGEWAACDTLRDMLRELGVEASE